jgi:hypothetical protein
MKKYILILTVWLPMLLFSQDSLPKSIIEKLQRAKAEFKVSENYKTTDIINNNQMSYDFAIINKEKKVEIRYTIRPMDSLIIQKKNNPTSIMVDLNIMSKANFFAIAHNISDGIYKTQPINYDTTSSKKDYNANWGMMILVQPARQFANNYQNCFFVALHKNDIGDLYIFYLFEDVKDLQSILIRDSYFLKFE